MKWSLNELHKFKDEPLHVYETLALQQQLVERFPDQVLAVDPVQVDGYVSYGDGDVTMTIHVVTTSTVPSSRSLTPVQLPIDFSFTEYYVSDASHVDRYEDEDTVFLLEEGQSIDLDQAVSENILLGIPLQVLSEEEKNGSPLPTGNGWEVISEDDFLNTEAEHNNVDPRLAKLKELFPDQDNQND